MNPLNSPQAKFAKRLARADREAGRDPRKAKEDWLQEIYNAEYRKTRAPKRKPA